MSDDLSKVDWGKPIEAVNDFDGRVVGLIVTTLTTEDARLHLRRTKVSPADDAGMFWHADGQFSGVNTYNPNWRIRNVTEVPRNPEAPSDVITLTADQAAMLRKVLAAIGGCVGTTIGHQTFFVSAQVVQDARDALALLPEPVDADLVEARKQAAENAFNFFKDTGLAEEYLSGDMDESASIRLALAAIRRGRALERDRREG